MYLTYVEIHKYFTYIFKIIFKISNLSLCRLVNFLLPIKIGLRKIFPLICAIYVIECNVLFVGAICFMLI